MNEDSKHIFAKLTAHVALNKALIKENPEPYIDHLHKVNARLFSLLYKIETILHSDFIYTEAAALKVPPRDFQGAEHRRLVRIQKAISQYYEGE